MPTATDFPLRLNPVYFPEEKVRIGDDVYLTKIYNADNREFECWIRYDYFEYERAIHVTKLHVITACKDKYLLESVKELLFLREGRQIVLECEMELN